GVSMSWGTYSGARASRLTVDFARVRTVAAYLAIYLSAFVAFTVDIARMCWWFARVAGRSWLSRGLRITAVGACFGLAYCVNKALDRKSTRLNSSHVKISYAVFCLNKKISTT